MVGLTGKAIQNMEISVSQLGRRDPNFNAEVDSAADLSKIENMLVIPLTTKEENSVKKFVGVLHLLNYKEGEIETKQNVKISCK